MCLSWLAIKCSSFFITLKHKELKLFSHYSAIFSFEGIAVAGFERKKIGLSVDCTTPVQLLLAQRRFDWIFNGDIGIKYSFSKNSLRKKIYLYNFNNCLEQYISCLILLCNLWPKWGHEWCMRHADYPKNKIVTKK